MLNLYRRLNTRSIAKARAPMLALVLLSLGLSLSLGCAKGNVCKDLASCGGNPMDKWAQVPRGEETPGTYCQEVVHAPPIESTLRGQLVPVARQRLPEQTTLDWCSELVITGDQKEAIKNHNYWWEDLPYLNGFLEYLPNQTYLAGLTRKGFVDRWYSQTCLRKYGFVGSCQDFKAAFERANQGAGEYNTFECSENAQRGGCDCSFQIFEVNKLYGTYAIEGSTITHYSASPVDHSSQVSFCVQDDKIKFSGKDNSFLWDRSGLRTMEMVRMNCNDGVLGPGELGIDCGLGCPNPCPAPPP
jgi:hypothetical protein